ncbi:MAG TPA: copper transporter [Actinomycetes bacterium]|nr:copper transporter [Actinomycetes bacterium]
MIDFRYHVVSIVAVFLALAVGIVLGSGPLKDDISGFLEDRTEQLAQEKVDLQDEVSALRNEIEYNESFSELSQPVLIDNLLTSHVTSVIVLPESDGDDVDAVENAIDSAGGTLGSRVTLQPSWGDPELADTLGRIASVRGDERGDDPYELAGQALADSLLDPGGRTIGEPPSDLSTLIALDSEGFVTTEGDVLSADTAVVVGPDGVVQGADRYVVPLLRSLDEIGEGTVLAAPLGSDESNGVIGVLRGSDVEATVSSEDRLDTVTGVTVTIAALAEQIAGGVGHYGMGEGADGPAPDPLPRG